MRIIIAGSGLLGVSVMEPLLDSGHEVVGLIQNGRSTPPAKRRAARLRVSFPPPTPRTPSPPSPDRTPHSRPAPLPRPDLAPRRRKKSP